MAPFITVFVGPKSADIIKAIEKFHPLFADCQNDTVQLIASKYQGSNSRFFIDDQMYRLEQMEDVPQFVIGFDECVCLSDDDWREIQSFFVSLILDYDIDPEWVERIRVWMPEVYSPEEKITLAKMLTEPVPKPNEEYSFHFEVDGTVCYAQVDKPFTDRPYTLLIEDYQNLVPLFTGLYVSTSWGVCNADYAFLEKLWQFLELEKDHGPLNLRERLLDEIGACHMGKPEPKLYRLPISDVKGMRKRKVRDEE
jgi:hypothetical protein